MDQYPLRLERYFFTRQEVLANPEHQQTGKKDGSAIQSDVNVFAVDERPGAYGVEVTLRLDEDASENAPYSFCIQAFAVFVQSAELPPDQALQLAASTGLNMLIGAMRERLADLTGRGPWGAFMLNLVVINTKIEKISE